MKKVIAIMTMVMVLMVGLTGCGGEKVEDSTSSLPKLKWYVMFQEQKDFNEVQEKINEITREKIGAEVEIVRIDLPSYREKLKLALASKENIDLCYTGMTYGYHNYVDNGSFLPLDDLLEKYAPKSYEQIPKEYWDVARVDGKIYGFINYQIVARQEGYVGIKDVLDKSGADLKSVKNFEELEPVLEKIKASSGPDVIPYAASKYTIRNMLGEKGIQIIADFVGYYDTDDSDLKVFNIYDEPLYEQSARLMKRWCDKGYTDKEAATVTNLRERISAGKIIIWPDTINPGVEANFKEMAGGKDVETVVTTPAIVTTKSVLATMQGLCSTSEHPELAVKFLELINTNEDNIYNILNFGIEGKHYNKVSENRIEMVKNSGYNPNMAWEFGNQFNAYLLPGQPETVWDDIKALNDSAFKSRILGFMFDEEPVKTEIALCSSIIDEYEPSLATGIVDVDTYLPEFREKLKNAGIDKVVKEVRRQLDEWKKNN